MVDGTKNKVDWEHGPQCVKDETEAVCKPNELKRTIDWKQGLAIALGVPVLILPSIGYTANYLWAGAVILWALSVIQGFLQNFAYGEMATAFPKASGLPGFAQAAFSRKDYKGKYDRGRLIGGFSAWSYWFAWNSVLAIFSITAGYYLQGLIPELASVDIVALSLVVGGLIFGGLIIINSRGLTNGAKIGLIMAVVSIVPLVIISVAPVFTGSFHLENITGNLLPTDWTWDMHHILLLLGLFAIAEWSACGWETAALYGPQYKKPNSDVPKALFICGIICLFTFVWVQMAATGVLGIDGIAAEPVSPLLPLANLTFGQLGGAIMVVMLITAIVLIIQTALLGSGIAMQQMAMDRNLPKFLAPLNEKGIPIRAMVLTSVFNMFLITLKTPTAILAASAIGYTFANGISLFAYIKAKRDPELKKLKREFKAPRGWIYVAVLVGLFNVPICLIGLVYLQVFEAGPTAVLVGILVLASYIPIWFYSQNERKEAQLETKKGVEPTQ